MAFRKGSNSLNPVYPTAFLLKSKRKNPFDLDTPTESPKDFLPSDFEKILKYTATPIELSTTFV